MGFLSRLFGGKKSGFPAGRSDKPGSEAGKSKWRWNFMKQSKDKSQIATSDLNDPDPSKSSASFTESLNANKHAIAVAAATAAVAEAALAAAHAAAEVVRLTGGGGGGSSTSSRPPTAAHGGASQHRWLEEAAAVKIQSAFRSYLARRALRALKALVKLQALVRGHIVRKQTADMLRRMQTLVRLQSRARASRVYLSDTLHSTKSSLSQHPVPEDYEYPFRAYSTKYDGSSVLKRCSSNANFREIRSERARFGSNWFDHWMEENVWNHPRDDEKSDKILEVDTWKPHLNTHSENLLTYDSPSKRSTRPLNQSLFLNSFKFQKGREDKLSRTAENSPEAFSASRRRGDFTPTRSECGYLGYPNYMSYTESSRAKVRSLSAPRQRLWDAGPNSDRHADLRSQNLTSSGHFSKIGSSNLR